VRVCVCVRACVRLAVCVRACVWLCAGARPDWTGRVCSHRAAGTVQDLRFAVSALVGVPTERLRLMEVFNKKIQDEQVVIFTPFVSVYPRLLHCLHGHAPSSCGICDRTETVCAE
jgi:hypothetical protein